MFELGPIGLSLACDDRTGIAVLTNFGGLEFRIAVAGQSTEGLKEPQRYSLGSVQGFEEGYDTVSLHREVGAAPGIDT